MIWGTDLLESVDAAPQWEAGDGPCFILALAEARGAARPRGLADFVEIGSLFITARSKDSGLLQKEAAGAERAEFGEDNAAEECLKFKVNKETGHYFRSFAARFNMPS